MSGFELLEQMKKDERYRDVPVIVYTGKDLSARRRRACKKYAETIIVKDVRSPERLLDETALFLHRVEAQLPGAQAADARAAALGRRGLRRARRSLVVDDDVRNIFALASVLEDTGCTSLYAENGARGARAARSDTRTSTSC